VFVPSRTSYSCQPTRGGPPALGLGLGLTTPHHKKIRLLRNARKGLRLAWIL
jgi:hypothetical protein